MTQLVKLFSSKVLCCAAATAILCGTAAAAEASDPGTPPEKNLETEAPEQTAEPTGSDEVVNAESSADPQNPMPAPALPDPALRLRQIEAVNDVYWPVPPRTEERREGPDTAYGILRRMSLSEDEGVRATALRELERVGVPADVEPLVRGLAAPSESVRRAAVSALVAAPPDKAFEAVMWVLAQGSREQILGLDPAFPQLRDSLEDRMIEVLKATDAGDLRKSAAAYSLGRMGSVAAMTLLTELAWSGESQVAAFSTNALANMGDARTVQPLIDLLRHPDPAVQAEAVLGLAKAGGPQVVAALSEVALGRIPTTGPVRREAVKVVGLLGDLSVVPVLVKSMQNDYNVRHEAGAALRRLTGADVRDEPMAWAQWLNEVQAAQAAAQQPPPLVPALPPDPNVQRVLEEAQREAAGQGN